MAQTLTTEQLEMINGLVQRGLMQVASIDSSGEPSYLLGSRVLEAMKGPGCEPEARADQRLTGESSA